MKVVNFRVGDSTFLTTDETLELCGPVISKIREENGTFLDRDGKTFGHVLTYVRSGVIPRDADCHVLLQEARYLCLHALEEEVQRVVGSRNDVETSLHLIAEALQQISRHMSRLG